MKPSPLEVYRRLRRRFGPQGWWPFTHDEKRGPEYRPGNWKPPSEKARWEICIGAILTQNTAWTNVDKALRGLQKAGALSPSKILSMPVGRLARLIRPSGYFNQKARRLKFFVRHLKNHWNGRLDGFFDRPVEAARRELVSLHGIGPETADSMILYAGAKPSFVVDAYTRRAGRRIGFFKSDDYETARSFFQRHFPENVRRWNEFHALWVALGKNFCRAEPLCPPCPLAKICAYALNRNVVKWPKAIQ